VEKTKNAKRTGRNNSFGYVEIPTKCLRIRGQERKEVRRRIITIKKAHLPCCKVY